MSRKQARYIAKLIIGNFLADAENWEEHPNLSYGLTTEECKMVDKEVARILRSICRVYKL